MSNNVTLNLNNYTFTEAEADAVLGAIGSRVRELSCLLADPRVTWRDEAQKQATSDLKMLLNNLRDKVDAVEGY